MIRPTRGKVCMEKAFAISKRGTCVRRQVGCILTDIRGNQISEGYNGVPSGWSHCSENNLCPGANAGSGELLEDCEAIHAEQNALIRCSDFMAIYSCYLTTAPCRHCVKMLLGTPCQFIVFDAEYSHGDAKSVWMTARSHPIWIDSRQYHHLPHRQWIHQPI